MMFQFLTRLFLVASLSFTFAWATPDALLPLEAALFKEPAPNAGAVAVVPLKGSTPEDSVLGVDVAEALVQSAANQGWSLVERAQFQKLVQSQQEAASGLFSDAGAPQLGELLSARYLILGSVSNLMGRKQIQARLIDTETGKILRTASVNINPAQAKGLRKEMLGDAGQTSGYVFRSAVMPGWGQFAAHRPVRGTFWLSAFAGAATWGVLSQLSAQKSYDSYKEYVEGWSRTDVISQRKTSYCQENFSLCEDNEPKDYKQWTEWRLRQNDIKYSDYNSQSKFAMMAWGITAGVWALNLADAWWVGSQQAREIQWYFSALPQVSQQNPLFVGYNQSWDYQVSITKSF
jgi:TolB-like protein